MTQYPDKIINIHAHSNLPQAIRNIRLGVESIPENSGPVSVGIHPWDIPAVNSAEILMQLPEMIASDRNIVAIGETGLDALRGAGLDTQNTIFVRHALIADKAGLPLIIHSVKSFHKILELHKKLRPSSSWAIHGFRGKAVMMAALHAAGIYTSIGQHVPRYLLQKELPQGIDPSLILAETDEGTELPELPLDIAENTATFLNIQR